jgi:UDP-GlcNAc3NAcA epimerase
MINIMTIIGARPQFIKASALSRELSKNSFIKEIIVHTGQHYDSNMSNIFFDELGLPSIDYNLGISNLSHGAMTGRMVEKIEDLVKKVQPDWVLLYGDTNSTLAGALAASKLHIPIIHVEAGLRSFNMMMPEEINRIITDRLSTLLICPTMSSINNLKFEGFPFNSYAGKRQIISNAGDIMYDVVLHYRKMLHRKFSLSDFGLPSSKYILCTLHRQENTDDKNRLLNIISALKKISKVYKVVLPLHPRTKNKIIELGNNKLLEDLLVLEPLSYLQMQYLQMNAKVICTDSGGVQKEAFFHKVQCVTLREETEWTETVESGWNCIVGSDFEKIVSAVTSVESKKKTTNTSLFGNGKTASKIVKLILENS